jgi:site-specific DNA-methyltransferase (adenine-specific)
LNLPAGLHLGDCRDLLKKVTPGSVDLIFADPPYFLSNGGFSVSSGKQVSVDKGTWDQSKGVDEDFNFHLEWLGLAREALGPNGSIFVSGTFHSVYKSGFALEKLGFRILNNITWFKPNAAPNLSGRSFAASNETIIWASRSASAKHLYNYEAMKHYDHTGDRIKNPGKQMRDVWAIPTPGKNEKTFGKHPTQKPLKLLERIVLAASNPGDLVLDPFLGSGTTGVAAVKHGREFIGFDSEEQYIHLARKRIEGIQNAS